MNYFLFILTTLGAVSAHAQVTTAMPPIFVPKNLVAKNFALGPKEIALTFDDGPGPNSLAFARLLARYNPPIPAVFFMVGKEAKARPEVVQEISSIRGPDGAPLFLVANHSWDHPELTKLSDVLDDQQFLKTDEVLSPFMTGFKYFRAPFGAFFSKPVRNRIMNAYNSLAEARDYIGPVFWDVGGFYVNGDTQNYYGDWSCWQKIHGVNRFTVEQCLDGYFSEIMKYKNQGDIVLSHDSHLGTIQMWGGADNLPNDPKGLIQRLLDQGFKFVRLDKDRDVNQALRQGVVK